MWILEHLQLVLLPFVFASLLETLACKTIEGSLNWQWNTLLMMW